MNHIVKDEVTAHSPFETGRDDRGGAMLPRVPSELKSPDRGVIIIFCVLKLSRVAKV